MVFLYAQQKGHTKMESINQKNSTDLIVGDRHMRAENRFYSSNHPEDKIWNIVASSMSTITGRLPFKQPNQFVSYTESFSSFIPFILVWKIQFRFKSIQAICLKIYDLRSYITRITDTFKPFKRFHRCWNDFAVLISFEEKKNCLSMRMRIVWSFGRKIGKKFECF